MGTDVYEDKLVKGKSIGEGAYGELFEGFDSVDNKTSYAVKITTVEDEFEGSIGPLVELDMLQRFSEHPFFVTLHGICLDSPFQDDDDEEQCQLSFILEKGDEDGKDFFTHERYTDRSYDSETIRLFMCQTLLALEYLHSRNVAHRDIKPGNIICKAKGKKLISSKLIDFGLSQDYSSIIPIESNVVTIWYRAPEIVLNLDYGFNSDIWSLGCVLYEILKGTPMFKKCNKEETLVNGIYSKFELPQTFKHVIQSVYPEIKKSKKEIQTLRNHLSLSKSKISLFNENDSRNFTNCVNLLENMLEVDPSLRFSSTDCLEHSFFQPLKELINETRSSFGINSKGVWITKSPHIYKCLNNNIRASCMKHFETIFNERMNKPISRWYSHRILFHAIEMCDRFLILDKHETASASNIVIWVNTFLFISAKYFRVMLKSYPASQFAIGISEDQHGLFTDHANIFEKHVITKVFRGEIYKPTLYDYSSEVMSNMQISYILRLVLEGSQINDKGIHKVLSIIRHKLYKLNMMKKISKLGSKSCIGPMNKKWTSSFV